MYLLTEFSKICAMLTKHSMMNKLKSSLAAEALCEMCPNTEFFLVGIFLYSDL